MTFRKHNAILVFVDKLTKWVYLVPTTKKCTTEEAIRLFKNTVITNHGTPKRLVSDRDSRFTSHFWREFAAGLDIQLSMSSAFHPQSDGQTEMANRTVEEVLRHFVLPSQRDWDEQLPMVQFAINNSKSATTGETPFFLNYGAHPNTPLVNQLPATSAIPALRTVFQELESTLRRAKVLHKAAQDRQSFHADKRRRPCTLKAGMQVLLSTKHLRFDKSNNKRKLGPLYVGPFTISKLLGTTAVKLQLPEHWKIHNVFHVSLVREYKAGPNTAIPIIPEIFDEDSDDTVDKILAHRDTVLRNRTVREYLIKLQGYSDVHNRWEAEQDVPRDLIEKYQAGHSF